MEGIAGGRTSLVVLLPILLFGIFRVVRYLSRLWHMHRLTADIPGPTLPLLLRLWEARRSESRVSIVLHDVLRDHPIIYKFWSGPFLFVVIQNARDMEFVLSSKAITRKSFLYRMLAMVQGKGLIHMNYGEEWKRHRKIVSPFLGSDVLKDFVPVFHQKSMLMVRHMESYARTGRIFNIHSFVALVINDSVCQTVMSTNMASQENDELAFGKAMTDSLAIITYRTLQPWFLSNAIFRLSRHHHAFEKNIAILKDFMQRVLETKKRERSQEPPQELFLEAKDAALPRKRKPTFVDLMLDSSEDAAFSDREIKEEAQTLVSAAAGATTDALAFVLLCLSLRQDIQDKVIQKHFDDLQFERVGHDGKKKLKRNAIPSIFGVDRGRRVLGDVTNQQPVNQAQEAQLSLNESETADAAAEVHFGWKNGNNFDRTPSLLHCCSENVSISLLSPVPKIQDHNISEISSGEKTVLIESRSVGSNLLLDDKTGMWVESLSPKKPPAPSADYTEVRKPGPFDILDEKTGIFHVSLQGCISAEPASPNGSSIISTPPRKVPSSDQMELDDIFTWSPDRVTTEEDLRQMQYLERVIKETLRMFPSIPVFGRSVSKDMKLPSGHWVPAGAQVLMCTLGMHKDPHSFPEPNHFDPDRFLPENAAGRSAFSFLPFSAGPRNCVGQRYAYVQIKTTVSTLLRHYRLLPSLDDRHPRTIEDIKTNLMVTLSARAGYNLRLQRRRPLAA